MRLTQALDALYPSGRIDGERLAADGLQLIHRTETGLVSLERRGGGVVMSCPMAEFQGWLADREAPK